MSEQLKVGIGADTSGLEKGLKDAEKALKTFSTKSKQIESQLKKNAIESSKLGAEISKLDLAFKKGTISESNYGKQMLKLTNEEKKLSSQSKILRNDLAKLNASTRDLGSKGMGALKKGVVNGNAASTAFSRTIQDMPFGIMGVSNNITNLTEQFGYLKRKTGSAKGALKAMLRDMKGFGGITLAISVATSLMLVFGDTLFKTKDKAKALKEEQEKLTKALKDYEDQLDATRKSQLIGGRASASELTNLKLLKNQISDNTRATSHRKKALAELQKLYPSYFKHLTTEIKDKDKLFFATQRLISKIEDHNKAKAAASLISKNQRKLTLLNIRSTQQRSDLNKAGAKTSLKYKEANEKYSASLKQINELTKKNTELMQIVRKAGGVVPLDFSIKKPDISKSIQIPFTATASEDIIGLDTIIDNYSDRIDMKGRLLAEKFKESSKLKTGALDTTETDASLTAFDMKLEQFNIAVEAMMRQAQFDAFSGFGEAMGSALANGENILAAVGASLLSTLGGIMVKYGKLILAYGIASEALKKAMENPFGGGIAAVVAGVALIAIGSAIKGFASNTSKGSTSSGSTSSGSRGASSTGSGYTAPRSYGSSSSFGSGNGTVVFEIAGQKLIGVLSNTMRQNRSLNGVVGFST
ncbi:MAG: hypothetical protein GY793_06505 [Proteobacteria bacterium]|nr:hypothetical protein [Pseudomonadota bacterium]